MSSMAGLSAIVALLLTSIWVAPSSSISEADVDSVCSATPDRSFCSSYLHSIPNLPTANFTTVCATTINTAISSTQKTVQHIQVLANRTTDRGLKVLLASCSENYNDATGDLGNALDSLGADDTDHVISEVAHARRDVELCQSKVNGTAIPLQKDYDDFNNYCTITLALLNNITHAAN